MVLADAQLYIALAILVAVAAIITPSTHPESRSLIPLSKAGVNAVALFLLAGVAINVGHILLKMVALTSYTDKWVVVDCIVHAGVLTAIMLILVVWYWAVSLYDEASATRPAAQAALES